MSNWLSRILPGGKAPELDEVTRATLERWKLLPEADLSVPHFETRYIAVSMVSGGEDQAPIAVAAIAVNGGKILASDACLADLSGEFPAQQLAQLLEFIGYQPIISFNVPYNRGAFERLCEQYLGKTPDSGWLDLAALLPHYFHDRANNAISMDHWLAAFGWPRASQVQKMGDALSIAQLAQAVLARANIDGDNTATSLFEAEKTRLWLRGH